MSKAILSHHRAADALSTTWLGGCQAPLAAAPPLWVSRLVVSEFRNYAYADIAIDRGSVVLTGPNGAGKTNLLEAVSFLAPGRGLRRVRIAEVTRRSAGEATAPPSRAWAVAATVITPGGPREVGTGRDLAKGETDNAGPDRRVVKIDGSFARGQQALSDILGVVWLTPAMDRLFLEGPSARRRFVDRLVCGFDPAHAGRLSAYEHALRERARLLQSSGDAEWQSALEDVMARQGVAIAAARRETVARLSAACEARDGPFPRAVLEVCGEVEASLDEMPALAAEDVLRARLASARAQDAQMGGAADGPHRSDLVVRHFETHRPAVECSTGEQKALLLAIILAHAGLLALGRGQPPLLLLDEVAAHLDRSLRGALFGEVLSLNCQAWLSGTDAALFDDLQGVAQYLDVRDAVVSRQLNRVPAGT